MKTLNHEWTNSKGDKLVFTGAIAYELDNSGNDKKNSPLRRITQALTVNGKEINGWIRDLETSHPLYKAGARAFFGQYAILGKDLDAIKALLLELEKSDEYQTSEEIKERAAKVDKEYREFAERVEEMSAMGERRK